MHFLMTDEQDNLHSACLKLDLKRVRQLIDEGADVNAKIQLGYTPLAISLLTTVVNLGEDVDSLAEDEKQIIKLLLVSGADLNQRQRSDTITALDIAIFSRYLYEKHSFIRDTNTPIIIIEHVAEVEARTNRRVFDNHNRALINKHPELKEHYKKCHAELINMWCSMIEGTSITYFSILIEPLEVVARYARNKEFVQEFESGYYQTAYPVYASKLREKFDAAVARQKRIEQVFITLSRMLPFADPSNVIFENILKYLSEEDCNLLIEQFYFLLNMHSREQYFYFFTRDNKL